MKSINTLVTLKRTLYGDTKHLLSGIYRAAERNVERLAICSKEDLTMYLKTSSATNISPALLIYYPNKNPLCCFYMGRCICDLVSQYIIFWSAAVPLCKGIKVSLSFLFLFLLNRSPFHFMLPWCYPSKHHYEDFCYFFYVVIFLFPNVMAPLQARYICFYSWFDGIWILA